MIAFPEQAHKLYSAYAEAARALRVLRLSRARAEPQPRSANLDHVRLADVGDEEQLFLLVRLMHEESGFHPLDWSKVTERIQLATSHKAGIIGVIGERHDLKAAIYLNLESPWYSDDWFLQEYFCFVRPDARASYYARDLIAYAKHTADGMGLDLLVGVLSDVRTEGKCRLYRRWLPKVGEYFGYRPERRLMAEVRLAQAKPANEVAAE